MPHKCMECNSVHESSEMDLTTGCPICGGKKFQYVRPAKKEPRDVRKLTVAEYVAHAAAAEAGGEDPRERVSTKAGPALEVNAEMAPKKKPDQERVESVRILEKGSYDINLPVLLNRRELVMSKEDGIYIVDLPSALKAPKKKKR